MAPQHYNFFTIIIFFRHIFSVPASNKRDQRTIEQVLADTRAKKKQKMDPSLDTPSSPQESSLEAPSSPGNSVNQNVKSSTEFQKEDSL